MAFWCHPKASPIPLRIGPEIGHRAAQWPRSHSIGNHRCLLRAQYGVLSCHRREPGDTSQAVWLRMPDDRQSVGEIEQRRCAERRIAIAVPHLVVPDRAACDGLAG